MAIDDIRAADFPTDLDWSYEGRVASLDRLRGHVVGEHDRAISWYWESRRSFATFARTSRVVAVTCSAIGGLLVLLPPSMGAGSTLAESQPLVAYAFLPPVWLGLGALAMAMDRLYGWSDSWRRYVMTATQLQWSLSGFQLSWEQRRNQWRASTPTEEEAAEALLEAHRALDVLRTMVLTETRTWANTLQQTQLDLENTFQQTRQSAPAVLAPPMGRLTVSIDVPTEEWELDVQPAPKRYERSKGQITAHGVPAGLASVSVRVPVEGEDPWVETRKVVVSPESETTLDLRRPAA